MSQDLSQDVALVTGGGRGIGRAVALALAGAGATVGVIARSTGEIAETVAMIESAGGRAAAASFDVTKVEDVDAGVQELTTRLGFPTILVNNAGAPGPAGVDWKSDPTAWWECIDVSLRGAFLMCRAVLPGMTERRVGRIINMASITGTRPFPPIFATSVAKTALIRFTEGLAGQLAPHSVRAFAIHPGVVRTRLLDSYGLELPAEWFVGPELAGDLCVQLAGGRYDALSGRFLGIGDDLEALLGRAPELVDRELYALRIQT